PRQFSPGLQRPARRVSAWARTVPVLLIGNPGRTTKLDGPPNTFDVIQEQIEVQSILDRLGLWHPPQGQRHAVTAKGDVAVGDSTLHLQPRRRLPELRLTIQLATIEGELDEHADILRHTRCLRNALYIAWRARRWVERVTA